MLEPYAKYSMRPPRAPSGPPGLGPGDQHTASAGLRSSIVTSGSDEAVRGVGDAYAPAADARPLGRAAGRATLPAPTAVSAASRSVARGGASSHPCLTGGKPSPALPRRDPASVEFSREGRPSYAMTEPNQGPIESIYD